VERQKVFVALVAGVASFLLGGAAHAGPAEGIACGVGKYNANSVVLLDANRDGGWNGPATDILHGIAQVFPRGMPLVGDFNGDGRDEVGKFDPASSGFFLDDNGNNQWESGTDLQTTFAKFANTEGTAIPIVGDWNMDNADEVGLYSVENDQFLFDLNGNGAWDGTAGGDAFLFIEPTAGPGVPIVGDWNGDGIDDVAKIVDTTYFIDSDGDRVWEASDVRSTFAGFATDFTPISGDWDGDGQDQIGKYQPSTDSFLLDSDANFAWGGPAADILLGIGQVFGAGTPMVCDFNGDGADDVGKFVDGPAQGDIVYLVDANGNKVWDNFAGGDLGSTFARFADDTTSFPLSGLWNDAPPAP